MHDQSFFRLFFSSLLSGFSKAFGVLLGIFFFFFVCLFISSQEKPPRYTTTTICPNHTWKTAPFANDRSTILRLSIDGVIGVRDNRGYVTAEDVEKILCDIAQLDLKEGALKGIIVSMNTPGGDARDSETIKALIQEAKERFHIPCIVYVDGLCASGGMMIACAADRIVASPSSLIGSVGVIMPTTFNVAQPMAQLGIQAKTLHAGKDKDELNPFRPWTENEGVDIQEDLNKYYERFVSIVCQARPKLSADFLKTTGAKVYLAQEAKELGFIDDIESSYFRCLEKLSTSLGIDDKYQVIELVPQFSFGSLIGMGAEALLHPSIQHTIRLPGEMHTQDEGRPLYLYKK